jgi:hypothetical protein
MKIKYQVEDGYVTGARPQSVQIDADELDEFETEEEVEDFLNDIVQEDMLQKVSADIENMDELISEWKQRRIATDAKGAGP